MKKITTLLLAFFTVSLIGLTSCGDADVDVEGKEQETENAMDKTGEDIEDAANNAGDAINDAANDAGNAIDSAADNVEDHIDGDADHDGH